MKLFETTSFNIKAQTFYEFICETLYRPSWKNFATDTTMSYDDNEYSKQIGEIVTIMLNAETLEKVIFITNDAGMGVDYAYFLNLCNGLDKEEMRTVTGMGQHAYIVKYSHANKPIINVAIRSQEDGDKDFFLINEDDFDAFGGTKAGDSKEFSENDSANEAYAQTFSLEHFKSLKSFAERMRYCEANMQKLAAGSDRVVYKIDDRMVFKLAKNQKGIAQNENEISYSRDYYIESYIAEIYECDDENYTWLEMELCSKVTPNIFKSKIGVSFNDFASIIRHEESARGNSRYKYPKPSIQIDWYENDFISGIIDVMANYDMPAGDLCRLSTYGVNHNGDIVIIDAGLTNDIYNNFYKK